MHPVQKNYRQGFTLIELSIVLVIIGLIVGGVLVGQDLIKAAAARATIAQIEKYQTAVNTFRGKYGYLPGDIKDPDASSFGFAARGPLPGQGDGNGLLQGNSGGVGPYLGLGEIPVFWVDLSTAHLIDGGFNTATPVVVGYSPFSLTTTPNVDAYMPAAKIGGGNYIYVYSNNSINYFGMSAIIDVGYSSNDTATTIPVVQAYNIDKKVDDGFPESGNVTAQYIVFGEQVYNNSTQGPLVNPTGGDASTCYDNRNTMNGTPQYSLEWNSGSGANCALSFRFQ